MRLFAQLIGVCLYLCLLPAGLVAGAAVAPAAELFGKQIRSIELEADGPLDQEQFERCLGLTAGLPLTRTDLKGAIQGLYDTGNFSEILVRAFPEGEGVRLQFQLRLSAYFNRFLMSGGIDLGGRTAAEVMDLPVGERYSPGKLEDARLSVLNYMHGKGYYQATVNARVVPAGDRSVDAIFAVAPGSPARVLSFAVDGVPANEERVIRERLRVREGSGYDRDRFRKSLDDLRKYFLDRGFLETEPQLSESYRSEDNSIALRLSFANFGRVRVAVEGFKIPKEQLRRLLPILSGAGVRPELQEEGKENLRSYLEGLGYPEAAIVVREDQDASGTRVIRYNIDRGHKITVSAVEFRGNRFFTAAELLASIQIQPERFLRKSAYSVSMLDADVETLGNLYRSAGFLDVSVVPLVELLESGDRIRIVFECAEGMRARLRSVTLAGNEHLATDFLLAKMRLRRAGDPYSPSLAEHDRQVLLAAYNDAGYLQPSVRYRVEGPDPERGYAVTFQIEEGVQTFVNKIVVLGKERTRASVIEKRLKLEPNAPLSLGRMLETQQALYNTGVFDLVRVAPQNPEGNSPVQNVIVRVQEARPVTVRYGFGYQEREKLRGILELSDLNIFGLGQRVDLRLRGSRIEQAGVLTFQPPLVSILPVDSYFTFSASKKREISFDSRRLELSYQNSRPISSHAWNLLRYRFTNVRVSNLPPDLIPSLPRDDQERNLSAVSAIYINDTRDNYLDPATGFFTSTDLSLTFKLPTGRFASGTYLTLYTQNSYFRRVTGPLMLASSLRLGVLHPIAGDRNIPISERFFAGGGSTLRGFETDMAGPLSPAGSPVGGNALLIGNLELRIPLISRLEMAAFYDGGNVFPELSSIRLSEISHTLGAGLRIKTPFGPIRIDYGLNLNLSQQLQDLGARKGHFFLTIGPPF